MRLQSTHTSRDEQLNAVRDRMTYQASASPFRGVWDRKKSMVPGWCSGLVRETPPPRITLVLIKSFFTNGPRVSDRRGLCFRLLLVIACILLVLPSNQVDAALVETKGEFCDEAT